MTERSSFLTGERPDDVAIYLADGHLENAAALEARAERVETGYVLVLDGASGRQLFPRIAGKNAMEFAQAAGRTEGTVSRTLTDGTCPDGAEAGEHELRFLLAFMQPETPEAGSPYDGGDVIHAYAQCACGTAYADRWVVGERA